MHADYLQKNAQCRASALRAAYDGGYGDAVILLRPCSTECVSTEPIERVQARYLSYVAVAYPAEEALAYLLGFGDAAADNLPSPSHALEQIAA